MRVLVVGNGQPLAATLHSLPEGTLAALLTSDEGARARAAAPVQPEETIRDVDALDAAGLLDADLLILANSTQIVPATVLAALRGRAVNFHPGLLPAYAGLHTHQWAIRNGDTAFGVTLHRVEEGVDTGDILAERRFAIAPEDTGLSLFRKCMKEGAALLAETVPRLVAGETVEGRPQDLSRRRLYRHAEALDDRIDWQLGAGAIRDFVRAGNYAPLRSPSYTARLHLFGVPPVDILRADPGEATEQRPGTLVEIGEGGPRIACGQGESVTLTRATRHGKALGPDDLQMLLMGAGIGPGTSLSDPDK